MSTATEKERNSVKWTMTHPGYFSATLLRPLSSNLTRLKKCPDLWTLRDLHRRRTRPHVWWPVRIRVPRGSFIAPATLAAIAQYNPRFVRNNGTCALMQRHFSSSAMDNSANRLEGTRLG